MADSAAVRARRRRAHLRGDHRECGPGCAALRTAAAAAVPRDCESVTEAVTAFADAVGGWPADDPRRTELALARVLAQRLDGGFGDWRQAEGLVQLMRTLAADPDRQPDFVDELRARGAARRVEVLARGAPA